MKNVVLLALAALAVGPVPIVAGCPPPEATSSSNAPSVHCAAKALALLFLIEGIKPAPGFFESKWQLDA